jgi:hypothetical protein
MGRDDDAHPSDAEHLFDTVFAREDVALADKGAPFRLHGGPSKRR